MRRVRNERGQTSAEYLGVVVAVGFIVAALVLKAPGVGEAIKTSIEGAICRIAGGECGAAAAASGHVRGDVEAGAEDGGAPFSDAFGGVGDFLGGAASGAADFGRGFARGTGTLLGGIWDTGVGALGFAYRSTGAYVFDRDAFERQWRSTGDFFSYAWNHPGEFGRGLVDVLVEPFTSRFEGGLTAEEVGELAPELIATLIPIGKLGKLAKLGRLGENADDAARLQRALRGRDFEGDELFHYTKSRYIERILRNGLRPGTYTTPDGSLSFVQAHIDLALPPNGLRDTLVRIDVAAMRRDGYVIPPMRRVKGERNAPGGGWEIQFPYEIPPQYIKIVKAPSNK